MSTSYDQWLNTLYVQLDQTLQTHKASQTKINLPRPVTGRMGGKISIWSNFNLMCEKIQREPQQVADYIAEELCTTVSLTEKKELKIQYRLGSEKACQIFSKYMNMWARCNTCKSLHTILVRHAVGRYYVIQCESCLSEHAVNK